MYMGLPKTSKGHRTLLQTSEDYMQAHISLHVFDWDQCADGSLPSTDAGVGGVPHSSTGIAVVPEQTETHTQTHTENV